MASSGNQERTREKETILKLNYIVGRCNYLTFINNSYFEWGKYKREVPRKHSKQ